MPRPHVLAAALLSLAALPASAANLLGNGAMQTPTTGVAVGAITRYTSPPGGSTATPKSAASKWVVFLDDTGGSTITTQLVPSTFPGAPTGTRMLHVTVNNNAVGSGLFNILPKALPSTYYVCAWIYINHGAVGIGAGNGAYTTVVDTKDRQNAWEVMTVRGMNLGTPPSDSTNLALVYAMPSINDAQPVTDFYVQAVSLATTQTQCKPF